MMALLKDETFGCGGPIRDLIPTLAGMVENRVISIYFTKIPENDPGFPQPIKS